MQRSGMLRNHMRAERTVSPVVPTEGPSRADPQPDCFWCGDELFETSGRLVCTSCAATFPKSTYLTGG